MSLYIDGCGLRLYEELRFPYNVKCYMFDLVLVAKNGDGYKPVHVNKFLI